MKEMNTRVINKHDYEVNWIKATNFIPKRGELIIYDAEFDDLGNTVALPAGRTEPIFYARYKIGDGVTNVNNLPFANSFITGYTETDPTVPAWAKAATKPTYNANEISLDTSQWAEGPEEDGGSSWVGGTISLNEALENMYYEYTDMVDDYVSTERKINGKTLAKDIQLSAFDVGADQSGAASTAVSTHNSDSASHADIREQISQLSSKFEETTADTAIPSYWQSALEEGAQAINEKLCTAGMNKSAFLFYSDAHWNYGSQMSPRLLKYLYKHTGMTKTFFGGDIVNNEASDYNTMKYLWEWRNQLKDLPNHHSVVGNHDDGNATNNLFTEQYVYGYLLAAEETPNIVRGGVTWYYIDNGAEKTRYVFLDTAYKGFNSDQQEFLKETLISTPSGWHIVVISHIWYGPDYDQYNARPIPIAGMTSDAKSVAAMLDLYNSRSGVYANCNGWVEFCIGGHVHRDYDGTTATGIPIILVETDSQHIRSAYTYTAGTTTEASVNGIIADYDNHKIYVVRIGRGESREIVVESNTVTYTNLIPTAVDIDGTTIFNGVGYKKDVRMSGSTGEYKDNTGTYCTGYMLVPQTSVITVRFKNITMDSSVNYGMNFWLYNEVHTAIIDSYNKELIDQYCNPVYDSNGNLVEFTISNGDKGYKYLVVDAVNIDETSIITINEPIINDDDDDNTYTNVLKTSLAADGVSIYNADGTPGYKANTRWSQSGQSESTSAGDYITGWIKVSPGDVIRLKNMTTQSSNFILLMSNACGSTSRSGNYNNIVGDQYYLGEVDENGNVIKFNIPSNFNYSYIRIMCGGIDDTSIITINEPID